MNQHSLTISKMINGGYGLGQLESGITAMVRHVLPGEQVTIATEEQKKHYLVGRLLHIEQPSDYRATPPCPYYSVCGGCDLQHAAYEEQLRIKHSVINDLLIREEKLDSLHLKSDVQPPLPSPLTSGYRQRLRLWVKNGNSCGFRQFRSHDIVVVSRCYIAREEINQTLSELSAITAFKQLLAITTELELLWNPASGNVSAIFHLNRKPRPADFTSAQALTAEIRVLERVFFSGQKFPLIAGSPTDADNAMAISYNNMNCGLPSLNMAWEVGGFCQVNLEQNRHLINLVCALAAVHKDETVLDLFCGSGNFSLPLATSAQSVTGIEGQGAAIRSARTNSMAMGLNNTSFHKKPIHTACQELVAAKESYDCLVIDPPRQGIPGLALSLYTLCRNRMVYISCDPATLCRDLGDLCSCGMRISAIQPVDMFPHTHHIETVVLLEKH